jgi:NodT family efflux transporter outer membrane factor (OMF) lipoprotein
VAADQIPRQRPSPRSLPSAAAMIAVWPTTTRAGCLRLTVSLLFAAALPACMVGPNYHRPDISTPAAFKEAAGWVPAHPADANDKGAWWSVFNDPVLDELEHRVQVSNQTLAAAEAAYREARAIVAADRAQLFPTVAVSGSATVSGSGGGSGGTIITASGAPVSTGGGTSRQFQVGAEASWAPDLWGRIRREIEGARDTAQASAADVANARLTAQSELASDYIELRMTDAEKDLLQRTLSAYERSLFVTENQYKAGNAPRSAMLTAETTLNSTKANLVDLDRQRTQAEHAIAVLIGQPPADLTIEAIASWSPAAPTTPLEVPSTLLQRRPDIAAAERSAAAANAQIGIAVAAYYPDLTLSGFYGFASTSLNTLFRSPSTLWSLGADVSETVLDFGARKAAVAQARAAYDNAVAGYRQTVLTAFQDVEDALAAARVLQSEQTFDADAASEATQNVTITLNEFQGGTVDFTTVATAEATALSAQESLLNVQAQRMTEAVDLIEALGGGWSAAEPNSK